MRATSWCLGAMLVLLIPLIATILVRHQPQTNSYIVQAHSVNDAQAAVEAVDGLFISDLKLINAVTAELTPEAATKLQAKGYLVTSDGPVFRAGDSAETYTSGYALYPAAATGVQALHESDVEGPKSECKAVSDTDWRVLRHEGTEERKFQGFGVTVAVIDTGLSKMNSDGDWKHNPQTGELFAENSGRCIVYRDFLPRTLANANTDKLARNSVDQHGHGTHVITTIADNYEVEMGGDATPTGVAPQVNLVVARALDANGAGSYSTVINAIDWIIQNKERYNIRVLNLSLYAPVQGPYRTDPLNQAVMRAWDAGLVVVVAAGNEGPTAQSITVPGNVPYVITVGAVQSGRYTASGYDELATYSSRGPTEMGFVKPDVVVPASRTIAVLPKNTTLTELMSDLREEYGCSDDPDYPVLASYCYEEKTPSDLKIGSLKSSDKRYQLSGTSMAAAEVSGIAALILQANPELTNDQVKYRLMMTARAAVNPDTNEPIYSLWEQGFGMVDAVSAITMPIEGQANIGLDLSIDLDSTRTDYFRGPTDYNEATGEYQLIHPETHEILNVWDGTGYVWNGTGYVWNGTGYVWNGTGYVWNGTGYVWNGTGYVWNGTGYVWNGTGYVWNGTGYVWNGTGYVWNGTGYVWNGTGYVWNGTGYVWNGTGYVWNGTGYVWNGTGYVWNGSTTPTNTTIASEQLIIE